MVIDGLIGQAQREGGWSARISTEMAPRVLPLASAHSKTVQHARERGRKSGDSCVTRACLYGSRGRTGHDQPAVQPGQAPAKVR